jgi:hypothetical protein
MQQKVDMLKTFQRRMTYWFDGERMFDPRGHYGCKNCFTIYTRYIIGLVILISIYIYMGVYIGYIDLR